jgi:2-polyprenyl-3-methyl-5-hydroxy-6-metoxy-1,4-benzoquinol methylase
MHHYRLHHDPLSSHQQIAALVREMKRSPVLDVGSAQGMLGQLLQGSGLEVDAVEPNPEWAESARPFYRQIQAASIEQADLREGYYQVIICADVLEHTMDPEGVLRRLRRCAAPDAVFVVSLPNIAHISVRLMLLFGFFPRMKRGVLDQTHRHFFTRDTAAQIFREVGLKVVRIGATPVPLDNPSKPAWVRSFIRMLMKAQGLAVLLLPRLFAMQWIFVATARKRKNEG